MKLQRTPLILLGIALLLGGSIYFYETRKTAQQEAQAAAEKLFTFEEADVRSLNLTTPKQTLAFTKTPAASLPKPSDQKSSQPASATVWKMTTPEQTLASEASVAYLLNLLATSKRQQSLTIPATQQAEFGFDRPQATITVTLNNQQTHRLILGKSNFNHSGVYAQVDPSANSGANLAIDLVSTGFENAVDRPLSEWKTKDGNNQKTPDFN